jgi:glutathione synthase
MRLIYLDGEALGAVLRVPREDDLRGNIHVGGTCVEVKVGEHERSICRRLAPALEKLGIYFAGLDIIGNYLTEVNVTSPTGIRELKKYGGTDLAVRFLDVIEAQLQAR